MKRPWANLEVGGLGSWSAEGRRGEEHCFGDDHPGQDDEGGDVGVGDGGPSDDGVGDGDLSEDDIGDGCGDHDKLFV